VDGQAKRSIELAPDEIQLVHTALEFLLSTLGREEADELERVEQLLDRFAALGGGQPS